MVAVTPKVHTEARTEVDPKLQNASTDSLHVGDRTRLDTGERGGDLGRGARIKPGEPASERACASLIDVLLDYHDGGNINVTFFKPLRGLAGWSPG